MLSKATRLGRALACLGLLLTLALTTVARQQQAQALVVPVEQPEHLTGSWFEAVLQASSQAQRPLEAAEIAAIVQARRGPVLYALRLRLSAATEVDDDDRVAMVYALQEECLAECRRQVQSRVVPRDPSAGEQVAFRLLAGDQEGALELAKGIDSADLSVDARIARGWLALVVGDEFVEDEWLPAAEDLDACREAASGATKALVVFADRRLLEMAAMRKEWHAFEESDPPTWALRSVSPTEPLEIAAALDTQAMEGLLAEALAIALPTSDVADPAIALLARAAKANVLDPRPHLATAKRCLGRDEFEPALVAIDAALRRDPLDDSAWAIRAIASRRSGDERAALLAAERALELRPGDPAHEERYVGSLVRLGLFSEAAAIARGVVASAPDQPWSAIALALDTNLPNTSMFQDALLEALEHQLSDTDLEARLWAAAACCVAKRSVTGEARVLLEGLVRYHADEPFGRAAAALLDDNASGTPFWSALSQQIRNRDAQARSMWRADALGRGVDAVRARGLLTDLGDSDSTTQTSEEARAGTPPLPTWAELPVEPIPLLPDPSACAVRVPSEAPTIEHALVALPDGASRIVLGRGTFLTPASIPRSMTLVGAGTHWETGTELRSNAGWFGECNASTASANTTQLVDLRIALRLKAKAGALALRRCRILTSMDLGDGVDAYLPLAVEFDHVQSDVTLIVSHNRGRVAVRDCIVVPSRDLSSASYFGGVEGAIDRSVFVSSWKRNAITSGNNADIQINDCVFLGSPAPDGTLGAAVGTFNSGKATVRNALAFDLDPCDDPLINVSHSRMRRTAATSVDTLGWTVFGAAVPLLDANAAVVRVPQDEASLDAAIARATAGATIQLGAGVFTLGTQIDRPLSIVGAGLSSTTVQLSASNATLNVTSRLELDKLFLTDASYNPNGGITQSALFTKLADAPPLVRALGGDLWFGSNVRVQGPLGLRVAASDGGVIRGNFSYWDLLGKRLLEGQADSAIVLGEQPYRSGHARGGSLALKPLQQAVMRPLLTALAPNPQATEARIQTERLERVDDYLAGLGDSATGVQLADIANRVWGLVPEESRVDEILGRVVPRLEARARRDARAGVEELIAFVFSDFGPGPADAQAFTILVSVTRSFRAACAAADSVFVEARLNGMNAAQADQAARSALMMEALSAGRTDQALALARELGDAARARVLVVHQPDQLAYEQLLALRSASGLDAVTAQRLEILTNALFKRSSPMAPSPPSGVGALIKYFDAQRTGIPNEFYYVVQVVDQYNTVRYYKAIERTGGYATSGASAVPRPEVPPSGSDEATWNRYYTALQSWNP